MSGARIALNSIPVPVGMPVVVNMNKMDNTPCFGDLVYDHSAGSVLMYQGGAWQAINPGEESRNECDRHKCAYCNTLSKEEKCPSCGAPRTGDAV